MFIIVFIYLLSTKLFPDQRGIRLLIGVAFLAFIILQGWYYIFMLLGKLWFITLIVLGFFWLALFGLRGGSKTSARGVPRGVTDGILAKLYKAGKDRAMGVTAVELSTLQADIDTLRNTEKGSHGIDEITKRINSMLLQIQGDPIKYGLNANQTKAMREEYNKICMQKGIKPPKT